MITLLRAQGLRVIIFTDDHEPAHVHVFGDGHAKVDLIGDDGLPRLVWCRGMKQAEVKKALKIVTEHRTMLLAQWKEIHD